MININDRIRHRYNSLPYNYQPNPPVYVLPATQGSASIISSNYFCRRHNSHLIVFCVPCTSSYCNGLQPSSYFVVNVNVFVVRKYKIRLRGPPTILIGACNQQQPHSLATPHDLSAKQKSKSVQMGHDPLITKIGYSHKPNLVYLQLASVNHTPKNRNEK